MKPQIFFAVAACALHAMAAEWVANPLTWTHDADLHVLRTDGTSSFAVADTPLAEDVSVEAKVRPESAGTNGWATLGVAIHDDDRNFWHVALVRSPPEEGPERHTFELCEMRGGVWLSQGVDKLKRLRHVHKGAWKYGETYDVSLRLDRAAHVISGEIKNSAGELLFSCAYELPALKAVARGRPAFHSTGSFRGSFIKPNFKNASFVKERRDVPAYASDSFLADVRDKATGFFRVVEKDGRWRVIDPFGRGMVLLGIDHVTYRGHYSQRTKRSVYQELNKLKFPNKADWEEDTLARLKRWGFNLLGAGCDPDLKHRGLVHTVFLSIGDGMCWNPNRPDLYICPNEHRPCSAFPNVFHPQFADWADWKARVGCAPHRDDPWLFGYFIDNELAWWGRGTAATGLFDAVSRLPDGHTAKIAQRKFLADRGVKGVPSAEDKLAFLKLAADIYFRVTSEAIRRHDPNHIVMGARFAGLWGAHPVVWEVSGKYCDLVTFNVYPWADIDRNVVRMRSSATAERVADAFTRQYGYVKKPMLVTEWSFPALDSGLPCTGGAGQRFRTQRERTQATELFARTMLSLPFFVGYDYFMWVDEPAAGISDAFPEDSNYGLVNENGDAYPEITKMFTRLHKEVASGAKITMPAERPAPNKKKEGLTANEFLDRFPSTGAGKVVFRRDGDAYELSNGAGLVLHGKLGGRYMFDSVALKGTKLGSYTGMLNDRIDGKPRWYDATHVTEAEWTPSGNGGTLFVTSEGVCSNGGKFSLKHAITIYAESPRFLCDLVEARNVGGVPIDVEAFYFREYAPYFADKLAMKVKNVPNLWKAPMRDAWFRRSDGAYYGGVSCAPLASSFTYLVMGGGRTQHPDAMFSPEGKLVLAPGESYRPERKMWMLAICGLDGVDGWRRVSSPDGESGASAETWRVTEFSFEAGADYDKTGADAVAFDALFTHESGEKISRPGFWDGGRTFRVRFAPTKPGVWFWSTTCRGDAALDGKIGSFVAKPYTGSLEIYRRGFVKAAKGAKHFTYADGTPFFYLGDTHWGLYKEEIDEPGPHAGATGAASHFKYIADRRAEQGFTVYQTEPIGAKFDVTDGKVDASDIPGFQLADRYYQHLADRGFVHANAEFFFASQMNRKLAGDPAAIDRLSRYWVARFGAYPVMWTLAQEADNDFYHERHGAHNFYCATNNPWVAVAECIHRADAYRHPLTAHQENTGHTTVTGRGSAPGGPDKFGGRSAFAAADVAARTGHTWWGVQWSPSLVSNPNGNVARDYWADPRPAINYEGRYCYLWTKDFGARAQGYISFLSGMFGYGYGAIDIWLYQSTYDVNRGSHDGVDAITPADKQVPWCVSVEFPSALQMAHMKKFFTSFDWWNLKPGFGDAARFTPRGGTAKAPAKGMAYVFATLANPGRVVFYFYGKSKLTGTVHGLAPSHAHSVRWFNTRTGEWKDETGSFVSDERGNLELPPKPDAADWALIVAELTAPASATVSPRP